MKAKLFLISVFALVVQISVAQRIGVLGGVNIANVNLPGTVVDVSPNSFTGFHLGPVVEFKLPKSFYLNTGLLYSQKGYSTEYLWSSSVKLNYIEVPLNLSYKFPLYDKINLYIQGGPYWGYAISGRIRSIDEALLDGPLDNDLMTEGMYKTSNIDFEKEGLKRSDFGVGFGTGIEYGHFVAGLNYQLGLTNMNVDPDSGEMKNKVFRVSLAYMFGGGEKKSEFRAHRSHLFNHGSRRRH